MAASFMAGIPALKELNADIRRRFTPKLNSSWLPVSSKVVLCSCPVLHVLETCSCPLLWE